MYDASYYAALGVSDPVSFANSASPTMDSGLSAEMEGAFGGGYSPGMAGGMTTPSMGSFTALQGLKQQADPKRGLAGGVAKSLSRFAMPGQYQMAPDRDLSQKPDDPNAIGIRGRHGGIMRPITEAAGTTQVAGPVVGNNYPSLRGLQRGAQGVYNA